MEEEYRCDEGERKDEDDKRVTVEDNGGRLVLAMMRRSGGKKTTRTPSNPVNHPYTISAWCSTTLPPPQRATSWALKLVTWQRVDYEKER